MQTFLPYADFAQSASVLDRGRLGKQRVENLQIMKALTDESYGWQNHPAVRMWRGNEDSLLGYQAAICYEWSAVRHYKDTCWAKTFDIFSASKFSFQPGIPSWIGDEAFHAAHRSNLLRKDKEWYSQFGWEEPDDLEYVWPV